MLDFLVQFFCTQPNPEPFETFPELNVKLFSLCKLVRNLPAAGTS